MRKLFTFSAVAMVALSAVAANDVTILWADTNDPFTPTSISPNGKWVCGSQSIWNLETGDILTKSDPSLYLASISNTGVAVGNSGDYAAMVEPDGSMKMFDGVSADHYSTARSISADGTIIVGSRFNTNYQQEAGYWENGEYHKLPIPEVLEDVPADVEIYSVAASSVNEDGTVIVGNIITGTSAEACVMWTRNASGEYDFHPLYAGFMEFGWEEEKPYIYISSQDVSANGKWIALVLQLNSFEDLGFYAGRYNVETGEIERAGKLNNITGNYEATAISNDGITVGFLEKENMTMFGRQSYIWDTTSSKPELLSAYCDGNSELKSLESDDALVYTSITPDATRIAGFSIIDGMTEAFVIDLSGGMGISSISAGGEGIDAIYNLQGQPITGKPLPGIYVVIENGNPRKVMIK